MRQGEGLAFGLAQAQLHGPQASERQKDVLGARLDSERVDVAVEAGLPGGVGGDEAEQKIGMAGEILGAGLDGEIDAMRMRLKE